MTLDDQGTMHERQIYSLMDMISDIAGIAELVKSFVGILIFRISKISYYMSATKKLFLVKYQKDTFNEKMKNQGKTLDEKLNIDSKGIQKWLSF